MVKKKLSAKMLFVALAIFSFSFCAFAQNVEEVTLTVSGDGDTKKDATDIALRSAVEQAFGVFISANTTILNDSLVKDEIATVSSGNIKKYDEIASLILPNGKTSVTLKTIVSISNLAKYTESHGSSVEFAGATFGANMKLKELNKINEEKAIDNMINQIKSLTTSMFDYELEMQDIKADYTMNVTVKILPNETTKLINFIITKTLESLSLNQQEKDEYENIGLESTLIQFGDIRSTKGNVYIFNGGGKSNSYCFRSKKSLEILEQFIICEFRDAIYNFKIIDNLQGISSVDINYGGYKYDYVMYNHNFHTYEKTTHKYSSKDDYSEPIKKLNGLIIESNVYKLGVKLPSTFHGNICLPHLYNKGYTLNLTLQIPKNDISKYSKFTIERK